ncbi:MAG: hypothetical protein DRP64_02875 [Verrucomicrobia bacterium]|nr:MAG: hypothetical protein DRP64_02875 [Verrucomicrobiota bacterium]
MKRVLKKRQKIVKGMPSAVALSILIHAALFLLAGMLVVFTVVRKEEQKFVPPKAVERPKMKLKKPKVKVKKTSKPKPTTRIATKVRKANMPDIVLPGMSLMTSGLAGGIGGFDTMSDLGEVSVFGSGQSIGNDFVGTFYDFKRDRQGRPLSTVKEDFAYKLANFVKRGWKTSVLASYYQSPRKLYTTSFMVPPIKSMLGPRAFGEDTGGWCWMVLYKGKLVYPEDIKFRFWGFGDDILLVRVDGKLVLNGNWHSDGGNTYVTDIGGSWDSTSNDDARYWYGNNKARVGDWIELKAGELHDMEVMIGEVPGGSFSAMLTVQVEGMEYERNRQGGPILPMFSTAEPSRDLQDAIYKDLIRGEVAVTNGPVFRDYLLMPQTNRMEAVAADSVETESKRHVWTRIDGKKIEAEYVTLIADKVVLEYSQGKQLKVPMANLSPVDREYIELLNSPKFAIDFVKLGNNKLNRYELSPMEIHWAVPQPRVNDYTFGAKVKQMSSGLYNHELTVEYFAIGKESLGNKYILLDRQSSTFTPTRENGRSHEFKGAPIELVEYDLDEQRRGAKPVGNLVTITDKRGHIIQYRAPYSWLWENIENLKRLPVGSYMDKTCTRVYPTPPKSTRW